MPSPADDVDPVARACAARSRRQSSSPMARRRAAEDSTIVGRDCTSAIAGRSGASPPARGGHASPSRRRLADRRCSERDRAQRRCGAAAGGDDAAARRRIRGRRRTSSRQHRPRPRSPPMPSLADRGDDVITPTRRLPAATRRSTPTGALGSAGRRNSHAGAAADRHLHRHAACASSWAQQLQPIVDRASADLVATINQHVGELLRAYVAEAIEREIEKWRQASHADAPGRADVSVTRMRLPRRRVAYAILFFGSHPRGRTRP